MIANEHIKSHRILTEKLLSFVSYTTICFILFSLLLSLTYFQADRPSDQLLIHVGLLQDLMSELPSGRQGLVCSLSVMPLSSLAALPFLPFLKPAAFGFAYLYGLAALLALSAMPLRRILGLTGLSRIEWATPLMLALIAFLLGRTEWIDLLACLPMLILAIYFETLELPELRALAGIFWALSIFAHPIGAFLFVIRLSRVLFKRLKGKCSAETSAVQWIQGVSILYAFGVYLFLNWMIMGSSIYPFVNASWSFSSGNTIKHKKQLVEILARQYPDCRPVVSGLWGYAIQPALNSEDLYRFIDFHPVKLPSDELGDMVLVIPVDGNPFARLNDMKLNAACMDKKFIVVKSSTKIDDWIFVRFEMKTVPLLR